MVKVFTHAEEKVLQKYNIDLVILQHVLGAAANSGTLVAEMCTHGQRNFNCPSTSLTVLTTDPEKVLTLLAGHLLEAKVPTLTKSIAKTVLKPDNQCYKEKNKRAHGYFIEISPYLLASSIGGSLLNVHDLC